jgi:eukaryotic-like serine/threonine-protein kinase
MSDTPHRSVPPARSDELIETGNPSVDPLSGRPLAPSGSDQSTITNARAPTDPNTDPIPDVPGYAIVAKIGEGGMGAVFLATDVQLKRKAALKTMKPALAADPRNRERFFREAQAAAAVEHDYIVPILHVGQASDGAPFIVMPLLKGEPLDARLARDRVAALDLILKVAAEVADGLAAAHARNLIHRDIKPGNIWLEGDSASPDPAQHVKRCKILDFGLARSVDTGDAQLTASGMILGTPAYMAPEQARGERVDPRADLFSLGAALYRTATGKMPFDGPTPMAVLLALTTEVPRPVRELAPHVPAELADLIDRLMSKDRERRPRTAAEVAATVRAIAEKSKGERSGSATAFAPAPDPISTSQPQLLAEERPTAAPVKRNRWPWVLGACVLALAPLGLWLAGAFAGKNSAGDVAESGNPPKQEKAEPPAKSEPPAKNEPPAKDEPPKVDLDRIPAKYVLSLGGMVSVNCEDENLAAEEELPERAFRLTAVYLGENARVTNAGLAAFAGCRHVTHLGLNNTVTSDAGLAHFKECKGLMYLYLRGTRVTSAGLATIADRTELLELDLGYTEVDDVGLAHLTRLTNLHVLYLKSTPVTAKGVADLAKALPKCQIDWDGGIIQPKKK